MGIWLLSETGDRRRLSLSYPSRSAPADATGDRGGGAAALAPDRRHARSAAAD